MIGRKKTPKIGRRGGFSARRINEGLDAIPSIEGGQGITVRRIGNRIVISTEAPVSKAPRAYMAKVIDWNQIGPNRWKYLVREQIRTGTAGSEETAWEDRPGGRVLDAFNMLEAYNTDSGVQGNGINVDTLPEGFEMQPIAIDAIVPVFFNHRADGADYELWFMAPNAVDGECPTR